MGIKILGICILTFLIEITTQLTCTIYDYSKDTVACVQQCPFNTVLADKNKCLRRDQYVSQGNVWICQSPHTSDDRTVCCQKNQFLFEGECYLCNGNVFENGAYCCSGSEYMNYAGKAPACTKTGTGECLAITVDTRFKVCCPTGQFYHLQLKSCVSSSTYNCDSTLKVCCNVGKYIQYVIEQDQYQCLQNCIWNKLDSSRCSQTYCNGFQSVASSSQSIRDFYRTKQMNQSNNFLLVFGTQCCYGISSKNQCFKNMTSDCGKRFINRGWSVCCPFGFYYNVQQKACLDTCSGYVVLDMICLTNSSYLMLNGQSGNAPTESTSPFCNGLTLPSQFPVCCTKGFYFSGLQGCKYCPGTIHKVGFYQACCLKNQYFDKNQQICKKCDGKVDSTGKICCFSAQYFSYSSSGVLSCNSFCDLGNIYKTQYCCESLSLSSCQTTTFKPSVCNDEFFIQGSCQVCPRFCSNIQGCTTSDPLKCNKTCKDNTVYFADLDQCLSCDNSCNGCTAPLDNIACTSCADGYVMFGGACTRCSFSCKTCSGSPTSCTSCLESSPKPYYENNQCSRLCEAGSYDDSNQCQQCNYNCMECDGSKSNQCSKCSKGSYVSTTFLGDCLSCGGSCDQCYRNSSSCIVCKGSYKYYPNTKTCTTACESSEVSVVFSNFEVCLRCHPSCKTCILAPQNCFSCKNESQYLDSQLGVNLCNDCVSPCVLCRSKDACTSCIDGYYLNADTQKCIQCLPTCKTCKNRLDNGCLSCFGDSQLVSGKCVGCSSSCAKCDINQNCLECNTNYFTFNGACLSQCPDGYFGSNKKCNICYSKCKTCSNGLQTGCLTCQDNLQLMGGKCVGCSENCLNCNAQLSCTQCYSGYYLYQDSCQTECPKGTYPLNPQCKTCPSSCTACVTGSNCTQCAVGYPILYKGECLIECPPGFEPILNSNGCQVKNNNNTNNNSTNNNTNNNSTNNNTNNNSTNNNTNNNSTNNNTNNNSTNNNTNNNTTNQTTTTFIMYETFHFDFANQIGYLSVYFSSTSTQDKINAIILSFKLYLVNLRTGATRQIPISVSNNDFPNKKVTFKVGPFTNLPVKDYDAILTIVPNKTVSSPTKKVNSPLQPSITQTKLLSDHSNFISVSQTSNQSYSYQKVSAQFYNQLIVSEYNSSPLSNIKIIGIIVSLMLLVYAMLSKMKSHFMAQQANSLILHFINFAQVVYLFKYLKLDENGFYGFLDGFGFSMLSFFPNFFVSTIPTDYVEITNIKSLVPDGNLIRNAGFVFSYQLIVLGCTLIGSIASYVWFKTSRLQEMPQIRKVMRMGVLVFSLGFLPQLFFSYVQLTIPSQIQPQHQHFSSVNNAFSFVVIFLVPVLMALIFYHYYATYNSDVLQHYYTLRQSAQFIQIYAQALILCMAVNRPLIALTLIPLQIVWLGFNYMLYRYGQGYHMMDCMKFIVTTGVICFAYLMLSLIQYVTWEVIITFTILSFATVLVYGLYQVIGLYYYYLFKDKSGKEG